MQECGLGFSLEDWKPWTVPFPEGGEGPLVHRLKVHITTCCCESVALLGGKALA